MAAPFPSEPRPPGTLRRLARATLFDLHRRRTAMFYSVVAAGAMLVFGATLFDGWLRESLARFLGYWLVCAWLTLLSLLLALFDLLLLHAQERRVRRELRKRLTPPGEEGEPP